MRCLRNALMAGATLLWCDGTAAAQTLVVLPDSSQTTAVTAVVSEQAKVVLPAIAMFNVTNVSATTASAAAAVAIDQIILSSPSKKLRLSLRAAAGSFTPPQSGAATWNAEDVSWSGGSWTDASGAAGTLNSVSYGLVASCNGSACSTSALVFSLAPQPTVKRAGTHTLVVTWKIESGS